VRRELRGRRRRIAAAYRAEELGYCDRGGLDMVAEKFGTLPASRRKN
jgi:hypothetical protein